MQLEQLILLAEVHLQQQQVAGYFHFHFAVIMSVLRSQNNHKPYGDDSRKLFD